MIPCSFRRRVTRGFTLIELLIVIVIIAILAAVTVIAYNGITDRAAAATTAENVHAYMNALEMYKVEHGTYYYGDSSDSYTFGVGCLASQNDQGCGFLVASGDGCAAQGTQPGKYPVGTPDNSGFNAAITPYLGKIPEDVTPVSTVSTLGTANGCTVSTEVDEPTYTSAMSITVLSDGSHKDTWGADPTHNGEAYEIQYSLPGHVDCPITGSVKDPSSNGHPYTTCVVFGGDVVTADS